MTDSALDFCNGVERCESSNTQEAEGEGDYVVMAMGLLFVAVQLAVDSSSIGALGVVSVTIVPYSGVLCCANINVARQWPQLTSALPQTRKRTLPGLHKTAAEEQSGNRAAVLGRELSAMDSK